VCHGHTSCVHLTLLLLLLLLLLLPLLLPPRAGTDEYIPVVTSGDLDEILYADTKRCPHLKVLMQASEAMLQGKGGEGAMGSCGEQD
jgi:hypothetical protein